MRARRILIFFLAAALWSLRAPAADTPAADAPAPLRVAVYPHAAPLIFKSGAKFSGLEAELARGLGEALGRPVVFVEVEWNDLIPALLDDRADIIMSGMSVTGLRQVRVAFCDPYLLTGQVPLCRADELPMYNNNPGLSNLRGDIGVVAGTTGDMLVNAQFAYAKRTPFATLGDAVQALLDKRVDLVITDYPIALWKSAEDETTVAVVPTLLTQETYAWAVRKDDEVLLANANAYLAQIRQNGRLSAIVRKWLPDVAGATIPLRTIPGAGPTPAAAKSN
jgi:polar amino acid transport system substrate-binding protein